MCLPVKSAAQGIKTKENAEFADTLNVHSIKQTVAGRELLFIDVLANIYRVNGVDVLQKFRTNIG
nr:phage major tail tube protein [Mannheimia haemolytica]